MNLTLEEVARVSPGRLFQGNSSLQLNGVSIDSRAIKPGELFVALKGEHTDGHNFLKEVKARKAGAALVRNNFPSRRIPPGLPFIRVKSPLKALGALARHYRLKFDIPVIAITGSCGKSTVKEMVAAILFTKFRGLKSEGNFNNELGLPLTLFRLNKEHAMAVLEMGMNRPGEIACLTRISEPSVGLITNINPVHLEGLGSLHGISRAKEELLLNLPAGAKAILNYDDPYLRKMGKRFRGEALTFGLGKGASFRAMEIRERGGVLSFRLNGKEKFSLPLLGQANVYNALAAIAAASLFDIPLKKVRGVLSSINPLPQRLEITEIGGVKIINDTYNANPASFRLAVDSLLSLGGKGRLIVVAGDMLELGRVSARAHYDLGCYIGKKGIDFVVTLGAWQRKIREGAGSAGMKKENIFSVSSPEEAATILLNMARPCDKILFKASRKIGLERAVNVLSSSLSSL